MKIIEWSMLLILENKIVFGSSMVMMAGGRGQRLQPWIQMKPLAKVGIGYGAQSD
jgi:hypothetical protein